MRPSATYLLPKPQREAVAKLVKVACAFDAWRAAVDRHDDHDFDRGLAVLAGELRAAQAAFGLEIVLDSELEHLENKSSLKS